MSVLYSFETGQPALAACAARSNASGEAPGTRAVTSSRLEVMANPSACLSRVMVQVVSMLSAVRCACASCAERAIEKHPACAAASNSSGFVPGASSNRVWNEYGVLENTPLGAESVPLPDFRSPRHCALAVRFIPLLDAVLKGKDAPQYPRQRSAYLLVFGTGSAHVLVFRTGSAYLRVFDTGILEDMEDLGGKVALVTGASRGIGREIAFALGRVGCHVAVNYLHRRQEAESAALAIGENGSGAMAVQADVSQNAEVRAMVRQVERVLGPIDIAVNNAGIARVQRIEEITEGDWNDLIAVNLTSCFLVTQAVLPGMRARRWGRVINVSSVAAQAGTVVGPHYAASKAGMLGLTRAYARLLAKEGITVNAIAPALIETDMVTSNPNAQPAIIPLGRFGKVDEVASVAVMLAGNGYITGQTINVNGGWYMS